MILYCFHYNASTSKYSPMLSNIMAGGGAVMLIVLAIFIAPFWFGKKRPKEIAKGDS